MKFKYIGIILFALLSLGMANQSVRKQISDYAATLINQCTLQDGYTCDEISEDDFTSAQTLDNLIPAVYLKAWGSAYQAFNELADLQPVQKDLKHYRIGFTESEDDYIILFSALLLPNKIVDDQPVGFSNVTFGKTVKFWVDKKDMSVKKHLFYK